MARVTATQVKVLWTPPSSSFTDANIESVIDTASLLVDDLVGEKCEKSGNAISAARLAQVELYVACYMLSTKSAPNSTFNVVQASATRQGGFSPIGMLGNQFGQIAVELDCTGCLRRVAAQAAAAAAGQTDDVETSEFAALSNAKLSLLTDDGRFSN